MTTERRSRRRTAGAAPPSRMRCPAECPSSISAPASGRPAFRVSPTSAAAPNAAARGAPYEPPAALPAGLRYLTPREVPQLFSFATDMLPVPARVNRLNDQALVRYYEEEWSRIDR